MLEFEATKARRWPSCETKRDLVVFYFKQLIIFLPLRIFVWMSSFYSFNCLLFLSSTWSFSLSNTFSFVARPWFSHLDIICILLQVFSICLLGLLSQCSSSFLPLSQRSSHMSSSSWNCRLWSSLCDSHTVKFVLCLKHLWILLPDILVPQYPQHFHSLGSSFFTPLGKVLKWLLWKSQLLSKGTVRFPIAQWTSIGAINTTWYCWKEIVIMIPFWSWQSVEALTDFTQQHLFPSVNYFLFHDLSPLVTIKASTSLRKTIIFKNCTLSSTTKGLIL